MKPRRSPRAGRDSTLEITSLSAIEHLLRHRPDRIRQLLISKEALSNRRVRDLEKLAGEEGISCHPFQPRERGEEPVRARLAPFVYLDHPEVLRLLEEKSPRTPELVLVLDHLQDPQNFGALCRTAEALGVRAIIIPRDRSVAVSEGVYAASVGAVDTIPVAQVTNLAETLRRLKEMGFWVVGTTLAEGATSPWDIPEFERIAVVLGTEWEGLSQGLEKLCDWKAQIPLRGRVQSLNVSAAGAIFLYELVRRSELSP